MRKKTLKIYLFQNETIYPLHKMTFKYFILRSERTQIIFVYSEFCIF